MTPRLRRTAAVPAGLLVASVLLLAGCGSDDSPAADSQSAAPSSNAPSTAASGTPSAAPSATAAAEPATITVKDFAYQVSGKVAPGSTVMIVNKDATAHTVTLKSDKKIDVTVDAKGKAMLTAPDKAGTYKLTCDFHGDMHGELVVA